MFKTAPVKKRIFVSLSFYLRELESMFTFFQCSFSGSKLWSGWSFVVVI